MSSKPHLSGYLKCLIADGAISQSDLACAQESALGKNISVVAVLAEEYKVPALQLATAISAEFAEPLFDLDVYDPAFLPIDALEDKFILKFKVIPLFRRGHILYVATSDPTRLDTFEALRFNSKLHIQFIVVEHDKLLSFIHTHFQEQEQFNFGDEIFDLEVPTEQPADETQLEPNEDEAPIVRYIHKMMVDAIRSNASDLHFEPYEKLYRVRYRIDGVLREVARPPLQIANRLTARLKVMSQMDIAEKRIPQDGRIKLKITQSRSIDFRVNTLPTLFGEKIVLRILDSSNAMLGIEALGYEPDQKQLFLDALARPQGMILITGPTGSGKTVSLYTGLNILNTEDTNISTAEDPVEINLEGINQVNVNNKVGLSFANALRSFLRQDPDVIMVGEIRDLETAEIAIKAAQTGHLVLSTLHTNSAPETLTRLRNMGVPSFNIATSVNLVIAQRLARRLCPKCKTLIDVPRPSLLELGFSEDQLQQPDFKIYQAVGCAECREGYKGRVGIYEVVQINPEIAQIIMEDGNAIQLSQAAQAAGFHNLRYSGLLKVMQGVTTLQEINRVTSA
jgi:type IV pilus assembly protein PilB